MIVSPMKNGIEPIGSICLIMLAYGGSRLRLYKVEKVDAIAKV